MITQKGLVLSWSSQYVNTVKEGKNLYLFVREVVYTTLEEVCSDFAENIEDICVNYEPVTSRDRSLVLYIDFMSGRDVGEISYSLRQYLSECVQAFIIAKKQLPDCTKMNIIFTMYQASRFMFSYEFFKK